MSEPQDGRTSGPATGDQWVAPGATPSGYDAARGAAVPPSPPPPMSEWSPLPDAPPGVGHPGWPAPITPIAYPYPPPGTYGYRNPLAAHKPGIIPLRPLSIGDILQAVFSSIRASPGVYFGITGIATAILIVLGIVGVFGVSAVNYGSTDSVTIAGLFAAAIGVLGLASGALGAVLGGIFAYPMTQQAVGRTPSPGETWRRTRRSLPSLAGCYLIMIAAIAVLVVPAAAAIGFVVATGSAALVVVVVLAGFATAIALCWLGIRVSLALPAIVVEHLGPVAGLRRSFALTSPVFWRLLGVLVLVMIITSIVSYVIGFGFQIIGYILSSALSDSTPIIVALTLIGTVIATLITQPFICAALAVLYLDSRIRSEGFDITLGHGAAEVAAGHHVDGWVPR